jgi:hypothetical protein
MIICSWYPLIVLLNWYVLQVIGPSKEK